MSSLRTRDARIDAASPTSRAGLALAIMLSAQLMIILDATVVNIALPHIQTSLHFSSTSLSWVMNGYTLTFGGLLLLGGRAGDILGRRRVFLAGIGLFTLASLAGGLSTSAGGGSSSPALPCSPSPRWPGGSRPPRGCCWRPGRCRARAGPWPRPPSSR